MSTHPFFLYEGHWIGEGKITFTSSPERLRFYTKWKIEKEEQGIIKCVQQVEMEGGEESAFNHFSFSSITPQGFVIELNSDQLGILKGKGIIDPKTIAWEFRGYPEFEGLEVYELQENGDYMLHAEYASTDQFRTIIDGRIWKKSS
jgi:hypothetical protein